MSLLFGALFYLVIAMVFLRKLLKKFFPDIVVAITIAAVVLGTNLAYYSSREGTMSHLYSFFLFTVFIL
ncbi:MAG: glycosyltransferase family 4 protein, partial [Bacteroidales bacterium]|nr:glycosyltransferase family 4 protein [Bacteroidales bacterium]